jgi:KDO2-lipid IV(A) lauroyltransferase
MEVIGYFLFYSINWLVSLLPLGVLYKISDLLYLFMYYFPGYRRDVVRNNLINAFPGKSDIEIKSIEKKFYHHLCDLFIETFKIPHLSTNQLMKRMIMTNPEVLDKLYNDGKDVVAILGHYANWEWLINLPLFSGFHTVSIYKPLNNKHFDRFMVNNRSRFGMVLTPMQNVAREAIKNRADKIKTIYSFLADQTPRREDIKLWTRFLNQETPVYTGAEKIAVKYNMAVIFFRIDKTSRGKYSCTVDLLFESVAGLPENIVTETHVRWLENIIINKPELWIWSHKRWKHKKDS